MNDFNSSNIKINGYKITPNRRKPQLKPDIVKLYVIKLNRTNRVIQYAKDSILFLLKGLIK